MTAPVDLTNLRDMTDGDTAMEKELFKEFISSFEAGLDVLTASCGDGAAETWRSKVHALKGIALNLGAERLGALCKDGQDKHLAGADTKRALLKDIQDEYQKVKLFLQKVH